MSVVIADLDSDGERDIAVTNFAGATVSVLRNKGGGVFEAAVDYPAGTEPVSVFAEDLNGDGRPDLAITNFDASTVSVLSAVCLP